MDPNVERSPALALPSPSGGFGAPSESLGGQGPSRAPEAAPMGPESAVGPAAPAIPVPLAPLPPASAAAHNPLSPGPQPAVASTPAPTNDSSATALDEEWINKAKMIIERTKEDPYTESKELGRAKADYLRIRHNKQVKVAEDSTQ